MKAGTRMALGVAAGYLLGRTKKGRLALMIAAAGATGKAGVSPAKLVQSGLKQLGTSPEVGQLTSLARDELLSAAKSAVVTAASGRIESLSERLQDGGALTHGKKSKADDEHDEEPNGEDEAQEETEDEPEVVDEDEDEDEAEAEAEAEAEEEEEEEEEEEPEPEKPQRRRAASRRASADNKDKDKDNGGERPRRSSGRRAASSGDGEGSGSARTATKRSPVRRTRR
ncbi:hypothetical protein QRX50_26615 [Amycolatopsis carbonis]|uniref:Histone protein n=1 Tax=Amycolatopsis carbonis TaxID=715471 RepID=A0A9Y2I8R6_9PSEU|nr:hypothetical protein [Amycolatopsis sp. 2-15]WIX75122.1 hypothetical protein QRX50_26615 [Amycolatopsis sp. 2-15]